jgi:hypothetical protein
MSACEAIFSRKRGTTHYQCAFDQALARGAEAQGKSAHGTARKKLTSDTGFALVRLADAAHEAGYFACVPQAEVPVQDKATCNPLLLDWMTVSATAQKSIERQGSGAAKTQSDEAGDIEEVSLIAWLSEMRASGVERLELDRAEAVGEVNRQYRDHQDKEHRQRREWHERADEDQQASHDLDYDRRPSREKSGGCSDCVQYADEIFRSTQQLGKAMLDEAESDDQT